jgi:hypothetical protein
MRTPAWLSLLSPLPPDAKVERVPVASAEQIASGSANAIAGWHSIRVHLSEPDFGLRHVLITLDQDDRLLSGGEHVMIVLETTPDGSEATLTEHETPAPISSVVQQLVTALLAEGRGEDDYSALATVLFDLAGLTAPGHG